MGVQPDVALSGEEPFRYAQGIKHRADYVKQTHQHKPSQGLLAYFVEPALDEAVVDRGNNSAQAEGHEDSCSQRAQSRLTELIPQTHNDRAYPQGANDAQIHHLGSEVAVEPVVQPRNERAHNQESDSTIIQLTKKLPDELRVAIKRVECEGEA